MLSTWWLKVMAAVEEQWRFTSLLLNSSRVVPKLWAATLCLFRFECSLPEVGNTSSLISSTNTARKDWAMKLLEMLSIDKRGIVPLINTSLMLTVFRHNIDNLENKCWWENDWNIAPICVSFVSWHILLYSFPCAVRFPSSTCCVWEHSAHEKHKYKYFMTHRWDEFVSDLDNSIAWYNTIHFNIRIELMFIMLQVEASCYDSSIDRKQAILGNASQHTIWRPQTSATLYRFTIREDVGFCRSTKKSWNDRSIAKDWVGNRIAARRSFKREAIFSSSLEVGDRRVVAVGLQQQFHFRWGASEEKIK